MSPLSVLTLAAGVGIPPRTMDRTWSMTDSLLLIVVYVAAFVIAVKLVSWIDIKLSSRQLFRDIHRELGIGKRPHR